MPEITVFEGVFKMHTETGTWGTAHCNKRGKVVVVIVFKPYLSVPQPMMDRIRHGLSGRAIVAV
jgi:hypothetical protein